MKKIFITGGAGYIGSHCAVSLIKRGYKPIIIDNFSNSYKNIIKKIQKITNKKIDYYQVDLKNKKKLISIFKKHKCHSVIHCAGYKSVQDSIVKPIAYYKNNIISTISLIECMEICKVYNLIFSSSATLYDEKQPLPLKETSKIGDLKNSYANTKYLIEKMLVDLARSNKNWSIKIARYFNPISNHPSGVLKETSKSISGNLIPNIVKVAKKQKAYLDIYGKDYSTKDGTCVRDYIHVVDLAEGHVALLKKMNIKGLEIYNFGTGVGYSVLELVNTFNKICGINIPYKFKKRRKGDIAMSVCSSQKARRDLNWKCYNGIEDAILHIKNSL